MQRAAALFALSAATFLLLGFLLRQVFTTSEGLSISGPKATHVVAYDAACYAAAAFLAVFACLYSFPLVRIGESAALRHFWATIAGVALFSAGILSLRLSMDRETGGIFKGTLYLAVAGMLLGAVLFAVGQFLLVAGIARSELNQSWN